MTKFKSIALRFAKGFIGGGMASVGALLKTGVTVSSVTDLQHLGFVLVSAFLTGGFLALEKWYNWVE